MKDNEATLLRFIKTFVVHLTAKRALENYCFKTKDHEVTISHFGVERSPLHIPSGSWLDMTTILRELFSSDPKPSTSADDAVKLLEEKIQNPPTEYTQKIVKIFKKIVLDKKVTFSGGLHCEGVLESLGKHFHDHLTDSEDNADLVCSCKVLLSTYIACSI